MQEKYGSEPLVYREPFYPGTRDSKYYLYLPIALAGKMEIKIPNDLKSYTNLIHNAIEFEQSRRSIGNLYIYLSIETSPLKMGITQKRPGWHTDGFLTDDINYIWYDDLPTEFCIQDFDIQPCHVKSMEQFEEQAKPENIVTYPPFRLIRMTQYHVHRASIPKENKHRRTFIKISFSKHKYNLKGNTHNPQLNYDWIMYDRQPIRNHPIHKETDFIT